LRMTEIIWEAADSPRDLYVEDDAKARMLASLLPMFRHEHDWQFDQRRSTHLMRSWRITYITGLLAVLVVVSPVVATVVYVHHSHLEAERLQIGADWQEQGLMSQQNYVRLRLVADGIRRTGSISDADLEWLLSLVDQSPSPIVHARVLGVFTILKAIPKNQKKQIRESIAPLLKSTDPLDRRYSRRVQSVLDSQ
jgi:hypothetical protein